MNTRVLGVVLAAGLFCGRDLWAHQVDEYLQATILRLAPRRIDASMRLVPGTLVSTSIIAGIDADGDGIFSQAEQLVYTEQVLRDLTISVDGHAVQPVLVSWSMPQPAELRDGLGEIRIDYWAELPEGGGRRTLTMSNHHLSGRSAYLVNTLVPEDRSLQVIRQRRNERQTVYQVDYRSPFSKSSKDDVGTAWFLVKRSFPEQFLQVFVHVAEKRHLLAAALTVTLSSLLDPIEGMLSSQCFAEAARWWPRRLLRVVPSGHRTAEQGRSSDVLKDLPARLPKKRRES